MTIDMTFERQMELMRDEVKREAEVRIEEEKQRADEAERKLAEFKRQYGIADEAN